MNTAQNGLDFGLALVALESGQAVYRAGWNGKGMWLALQTPDDNSKMTLPYIYMKTADGHMVPWLASQTDLLSKDWARMDVPEMPMPDWRRQENNK